MAILTQTESTPKNRILTEGMAPKGVHVAVCIEVEDHIGAKRIKYGTANEIETVDLTRFYFAFIKAEQPYIVRTRLMKISMHEKATLLAFLAPWLGEIPKAGFDTASLKGMAAQITISHTAAPGNGKVFANIAAISPLMEGLEDKVPNPKAFAKYLGEFQPLPPPRIDFVETAPTAPRPAGPSGMPKQSVSMDDLAGSAPSPFARRAHTVDDDDEIPL